MGKTVHNFENLLSEYLGNPTSGTAALHLALDAIGLKQGDEVIVPTITYLASFQQLLRLARLLFLAILIP